MKKIKISQLPLYNSLEGLSTIGTDADNRSVRVELSFIVQAFKEVVAEAKAAAEAAQSVADDTSAAISGKVDKVEGKGLSANDFTDAFKAKLEGLSNYDDAEVRSLITAVNGRLDTILGDGASSAIDTFNEIEAFLTGITDTQTLTGLLAEQKQTITAETDAKLSGKVDKVAGKGLSANDYTDEDKAKLAELPTKAELDSSLGAKLDKSKWDEEHEQFTIKGYYLGKTGNLGKTSSDVSGVTPLLPLSKTYPIVLKNVRAYNSAVAVGFYDATGSFISYPEGIENLNGDFIVNLGQYPENACFFRVCTEKTGSSYSNGPSVESREGAVSEAIQAVITAAADEELIAEAKVNGAVYNNKTGFFELNTLTDITAEQMRAILNFGRFHFTDPMAGAKSKGVNISDLIRTNILESSSDELRTFATANGLCYNQYNLEVLVVGLPPQYDQTYTFSPKSIFSMLQRCYKLHTIIGDIRLDRLETANEMAFVSCTELRNVRLRDIVKSLDISGAPLLSFDSVACMVDNAKNTEAISIKVHPDVYAKLTDATNAEWYAVAEAAAAKNIAFATTN